MDEFDNAAAASLVEFWLQRAAPRLNRMSYKRTLAKVVAVRLAEFDHPQTNANIRAMRTSTEMRKWVIESKYDSPPFSMAINRKGRIELEPQSRSNMARTNQHGLLNEVSKGHTIKSRTASSSLPSATNVLSATKPQEDSMPDTLKVDLESEFDAWHDQARRWNGRARWLSLIAMSGSDRDFCMSNPFRHAVDSVLGRCILPGSQSPATLSPESSLMGIDGTKWRNRLESLPQELIHNIIKTELEAAVRADVEMDVSNTYSRFKTHTRLTVKSTYRYSSDLKFDNYITIGFNYILLGGGIRATVLSIIRLERDRWTTHAQRRAKCTGEKRSSTFGNEPEARTYLRSMQHTYSI